MLAKLLQAIFGSKPDDGKVKPSAPKSMDVKVKADKKDGKKRKRRPPPPPTETTPKAKQGKGKGKGKDKEGLDISFKSKDSSKRGAFRVPTKGMTARIKGVPATLPVADLSVSGIGIALKLKKGKKIPKGKVLTLDVLGRDGNRMLQEVKAVVARHFEGVLGCRFKSLAPEDEDRLYKFVLKAQKKMAERKKGKSVPLG